MAKKDELKEDLILEFEMMTMIFIRAHRINDFKLYVESLVPSWITLIMPDGPSSREDARAAATSSNGSVGITTSRD